MEFHNIGAMIKKALPQVVSRLSSFDAGTRSMASDNDQSRHFLGYVDYKVYESGQKLIFKNWIVWSPRSLGNGLSQFCSDSSFIRSLRLRTDQGCTGSLMVEWESKSSIPRCNTLNFYTVVQISEKQQMSSSAVTNSCLKGPGSSWWQNLTSKT